VSALWTAAAAGLLFALGLGLGGMTDPVRVQGFLDFTGAWDASLAFVPVLLFVLSMFGGMGLFGWWERSRAQASAQRRGLTRP
jgi:uncharacterized membrane protein YedE/YeeE